MGGHRRRRARRAVRQAAGSPTSRYAVETSVRTAGRYGIVDGYGGHGIGTEMHQDPHVLNHGRPGRGPRLVPGLALAIEPMITLGSPRTAELADGWTVVTRDGSVAAHVEHTIALLDDGVWVLTAETAAAAGWATWSPPASRRPRWTPASPCRADVLIFRGSRPSVTGCAWKRGGDPR